MMVGRPSSYIIVYGSWKADQGKAEQFRVAPCLHTGVADDIALGKHPKGCATPMN